MYSCFSNNSEAFASGLLENHEDMLVTDRTNEPWTKSDCHNKPESLNG